MTFQNILVATDFSDTSEAAVAYARSLARCFGARLHLLHVTGNILETAAGIDGYTTDFAALQREAEESARKHVDNLVTDDDRQTLSASTVVLTSNSPAEAIVSYAADVTADLIVVGTHGWGAMAHLLMGSVAERVVRTAPCPVLVVRQPAAASASGTPRDVAAHA